MTKPVVLNLTWDELGIVVLGVQCFLDAACHSAVQDLDDSPERLQGIDEIDVLLGRLQVELERAPNHNASAKIANNGVQNSDSRTK